MYAATAVASFSDSDPGLLSGMESKTYFESCATDLSPSSRCLYFFDPSPWAPWQFAHFILKICSPLKSAATAGHAPTNSATNGSARTRQRSRGKRMGSSKLRSNGGGAQVGWESVQRLCLV